MRILMNAYFLAQHSGVLAAVRYAYRFGVNADRVLVLLLALTCLPFLLADIFSVLI